MDGSSTGPEMLKTAGESTERNPSERMISLDANIMRQVDLIELPPSEQANGAQEKLRGSIKNIAAQPLMWWCLNYLSKCCVTYYPNLMPHISAIYQELLGKHYVEAALRHGLLSLEDEEDENNNGIQSINETDRSNDGVSNDPQESVRGGQSDVPNVGSGKSS